MMVVQKDSKVVSQNVVAADRRLEKQLLDVTRKSRPERERRPSNQRLALLVDRAHACS